MKFYRELDEMPGRLGQMHGRPAMHLPIRSTIIGNSILWGCNEWEVRVKR